MKDLAKIVPLDGMKPQHISRQIIREMLSVNYVPKFPVKLSDTNDTIELSHELFDKLQNNYQDLINYIGGKPSEYSLIKVNAGLAQRIINHLPNNLKNLNPQISVQTIDSNGYGLFPHTDFQRSCSLFYLLDGEEGWDTVWLDSPIDPYIASRRFGEFTWNFADINNVTEAFKIQLKKDCWYLFDNRTYHAVLRNSTGEKRRSITIEFPSTLSIDEIHTLNFI
jgi:hypothetical protein